MKNNSKEVGKQIYRVYYNSITKSFEIKDFDITLVNNSGIYYISHNDIKLDPFAYIVEYKPLSTFVEDCVRLKLLDYFLGKNRCDIIYIISFIHKENAEEFIETHQDLLKIKDLGIYYDMIETQFKDSGTYLLIYLNEAINIIVKNKEKYKTDNIKDFLYAYISDVVDICEALKTEEKR